MNINIPRLSKPIISVSGLRGIVGENLDPYLAMRYARAFAATLPAGPIVLTRDGRASGTMFASAIASALTPIGRDVLYADVAATPTTGILVRQYEAAGGIQISASHNPAEYNGIKLFGNDGRVISAKLGQQVIDRFERPILWTSHERPGAEREIEDTVSEHKKLVLQTVDVDSIRKQNYRVVLDCNHGAGSILGAPLLADLNVQTKLMGDRPDGRFAHPPEPTCENLQGVAEAATREKVDVVFCQDPDADRLAVIDERGRYIGEEYTLALTLKNRLAKQPGPCVINCATSRMCLDIADRFDCQCYLSAVGEAHVCEKMLEVDAVYGGEGNGGPIDPTVGYVRDSFVAMAQILETMAKCGCTVSQLVEEIPRYSIHKEKMAIDVERLPQIFDNIESAFSSGASSRLDGLRLDWADRWLLVRPSNTEPIVRIICEARDLDSAVALAIEAKKIVGE